MNMIFAAWGDAATIVVVGLVVLLLVVGFVLMAKGWRYAIAAFVLLVVAMFVANTV